MKKIFGIIIIGAIVAITLIQSCVKEVYEFNEIEWNPNIAVPLVHSTLTLADILEHVDSNSKIHDHLVDDGTGFLTLVYSSTLFSAKASDLIDTIIDTIPPPFTYSNFPVQYPIHLNLDSISLNLEIYNEVTSGNFYFENPKLNIYITNSFGLPISIVIDTFEVKSFAYQGPLPNPLPIEIPIGSPPPITLPPPIPSTVPYQDTTTFYTFDKTNSNIQEILEISPKYLYYSIDAILNDPLTPNNFITDQSELTIKVELELPIYGNASDFMLADTLDFELGFNTDTFQVVEYAEFKLNVDNGLPVDINIQLDFIDSLNPTIILESLLDINSEVFLSGKVVNEVVTQSTLRTTTIAVDRAKLDKIGRANQVIIMAKLATTNVGSSSGPASPLVKFYSDYELDLKLGVRVQLKTTF